MPPAVFPRPVIGRPPGEPRLLPGRVAVVHEHHPADDERSLRLGQELHAPVPEYDVRPAGVEGVDAHHVVAVHGAGGHRPDRHPALGPGGVEEGEGVGRPAPPVRPRRLAVLPVGVGGGHRGDPRPEYGRAVLGLPLDVVERPAGQLGDEDRVRRAVGDLQHLPLLLEGVLDAGRGDDRVAGVQQRQAVAAAAEQGAVVGGRGLADVGGGEVVCGTRGRRVGERRVEGDRGRGRGREGVAVRGGRAAVHLELGLRQGQVVRRRRVGRAGVPRDVQVELREDLPLFEEREEVEPPAVLDAVGPGRAHGREVAVGALVVVKAQADLLEVVLARAAGRRLADLLDGGEEEADQDGDDRNHHQEFNQGKSRTPAHRGTWKDSGAARRGC
eukprot:Opistho-1_new@54167